MEWYAQNPAAPQAKGQNTACLLHATYTNYGICVQLSIFQQTVCY